MTPFEHYEPLVLDVGFPAGLAEPSTCLVAGRASLAASPRIAMNGAVFGRFFNPQTAPLFAAKANAGAVRTEGNASMLCVQPNFDAEQHVLFLKPHQRSESKIR